MEPFQIKLEPHQSPEKYDGVGNYKHYLKDDDVHENLLDNLKSEIADTSGISSFNLIKEEYDIPDDDDDHMISEDSNNSDLENQENYSVNIQWPSRKNEQINSEQQHTSTFDIFNFASKNNNLNDKVADANTINKKNDSFRKRSTPKFHHYCLHCSEARDGLLLFKKNDCMKCGKLMVIQCLKCKKNYENPHSMKYHLQVCNVHEKRFECAQCDFRTSTLVLLKHHKVKHAEGKELECSKCNKRFKKVVSFRSHRVYCGKEPGFACALCSFKTYRKYQLKRHLHLSHEKYFQKTVDDNNEASANLDYLDDKRSQKLYSCASKLQVFFQRFCSKCNETFENSFVHSNDCQICQTKLSIRCTECNSLHKNLLDITNHLRYSKCIFKTKLQCSTCDYSTIYPTNLKVHIQQIHAKIYPKNYYKCSKCSRSFKSKSNLNKHVKYSCSSDKLYLQCDHCDFKTKKKTGLVKHVRMHMASENSVKFCKTTMSADRKSRSKLLLGFCSKCETSRKVGKRTVCLKCKLPLVFPEKNSVETSTPQAQHLHEKREHDYFKCKNCGKIFAQMSNLDCHKKVCKSRISARN